MAFFMGMPFSIGMKMASTDEDSPTAFLWGINGAMSVVASVFATVIALFFGIIWTFIAGLAAYVLAAGSMYVLVKRLRGDTATEVSTNGAKATDANGDSADAEDEADTPEVAPAAT
jgi:hypothetical protein